MFTQEEENKINELKRQIVDLVVDNVDKFQWFLNNELECETRLSNGIYLYLSDYYSRWTGGDKVALWVYNGNQKMFRVNSYEYPQLTTDIFKKIQHNLRYEKCVENFTNVIDGIKNEIKDKEYDNGN